MASSSFTKNLPDSLPALKTIPCLRIAKKGVLRCLMRGTMLIDFGPSAICRQDYYNVAQDRTALDRVVVHLVWDNTHFACRCYDMSIDRGAPDAEPTSDLGRPQLFLICQSEHFVTVD